MKVLLSIATAVVFVFAFGLAFADEMPETRAIEWGAYFGGTISAHDLAMAGGKGAAAGGVREDVLEKSDAVFGSLLGSSESIDLPDPYRGLVTHEAGVKGAAPGGVREAEIEKSTVVFNSLFGTREGQPVNIY